MELDPLLHLRVQFAFAVHSEIVVLGLGEPTARP
jgi:hypothetical protein